MSKLDLGKKLEIGDVVFIRIPIPPFTEVASTTASWTNHVGIVVDVSGKEPLIAESRFPLSGLSFAFVHDLSFATGLMIAIGLCGGLAVRTTPRALP